MDKISEHWIEIAKVLADNPREKMLCPKCLLASLIVKDEEIENWPEAFDKHLICPNCGATNIITIKKKKRKR